LFPNIFSISNPAVFAVPKSEKSVVGVVAFCSLIKTFSDGIDDPSLP
jgi:ABC-type uncharacterized transport system permease subunit